MLLPFATATVPLPPAADAPDAVDMEWNEMNEMNESEKKGRYIEYSIFKSLYSLRIVFPKYHLIARFYIVCNICHIQFLFAYRSNAAFS